MPYIKKEDRNNLDEEINALIVKLKKGSEGEYNYVITRLLHHYIKNCGKKYDTLNSAIGILECAKQELYRTVVGPYEDLKKQENWNISELDR